jgi:hypothetical protein
MVSVDWACKRARMINIIADIANCLHYNRQFALSVLLSLLVLKLHEYVDCTEDVVIGTGKLICRLV